MTTTAAAPTVPATSSLAAQDYRHALQYQQRAEALRQAMLNMIDGPGYIDPETKSAVFSYAHPIFWAPFSLVGDGGGS